MSRLKANLLSSTYITKESLTPFPSYDKWGKLNTEVIYTSDWERIPGDNNVWVSDSSWQELTSDGWKVLREFDPGSLPK